MGEGVLASASPEAWTIVDGALYLNYNTEGLRSWKEHNAKKIRAAEKNWLTIFERTNKIIYESVGAPVYHANPNHRKKATRAACTTCSVS
mmetsp:Transcript_34346/g.63699  ORF Transcript_34346/g.63699 Transcript_34346/m.63699 type:complete len:90 (+) Transcript_34346:39-308(+)